MTCFSTYFKHIFKYWVPSYINGTTCENNYQGCVMLEWVT